MEILQYWELAERCRLRLIGEPRHPQFNFLCHMRASCLATQNTNTWACSNFNHRLNYHTHPIKMFYLRKYHTSNPNLSKVADVRESSKSVETSTASSIRSCCMYTRISSPAFLNWYIAKYDISVNSYCRWILNQIRYLDD